MAFRYQVFDDGSSGSWVDLPTARAWAAIAAQSLGGAVDDAAWAVGVSALANSAKALNLPLRAVALYPAVRGGEEGYSSPATLDRTLSSWSPAARGAQVAARLIEAQAIASDPWAYVQAKRASIQAANEVIAQRWGLEGPAVQAFTLAPETTVRMLGEEWDSTLQAKAQRASNAQADLISQVAAGTVIGAPVAAIVQAFKFLSNLAPFAVEASPGPPYVRTFSGGVTPDAPPVHSVPAPAGAPAGALLMPSRSIPLQSVATSLLLPRSGLQSQSFTLASGVERELSALEASQRANEARRAFWTQVGIAATVALVAWELSRKKGKKR